MPKRPTTGRVSVFRGKEDGVRVQGVLTRRGGQRFEGCRQELAALYMKVCGRGIVPSDADVIEYLSRGNGETEHYLQIEENRRNRRK